MVDLFDCPCPNNTDLLNKSLPTIAPNEWDAKDSLNLGKDEALQAFIEFKIAIAIDYYYVPVCSCLGIFGNIWSFITLMSATMRRSSTCQYMATIALADTVILILNILFLVRKFPGYEIFNAWTCRLILFIFFFAIHFDVSIMIAMTLEKYLAVRFPLKAASWTPRTKLVISVIALCISALNAQNLFTRDMIYNEATNSESCSPVSAEAEYFLFKIWPWIDSSVYCFIPLTSLFLLNILIIVWLKKSEKLRNTMENRSISTRIPSKAASTLSVDSSVSGASSKTKSKEAQITRMLLLVSFAFLLLVGPMAIIIIVEKRYDLSTTPYEAAKYHLTRTVINNLMYTNHSLNFVLYCFSAKRFRKATIQVLCCSRRSDSNGSVKFKNSSARPMSVSSIST